MTTPGLSSRAARALQCLDHNYLSLVLVAGQVEPFSAETQLPRLGTPISVPLPTRMGQRGRVCHENQHAKYKYAKAPVPSSMDVCDLGRGSGPPRLHKGGAKNIWVKKNHHTRGERLKIATYNVRTLLKDEHVQ